MADIVANSRNRAGLEAVPTNSSGVRQLLKALKQGRAIGLLPDQVPPDGQGVWVPFFGQNAYTMTLAARLAQQTGATVLMGWGERLSWGRGYLIHIEKLPLMVTQGEGVLSDDLTVACAQMNQAMETLILQKPSQYLWGYGRYKQPRTSTE
jgi:KDO2-lipid IV(A) lauroyltransferase